MSEQLLATPCVFGENENFILERELGRGGMGGVYLGRDKMLDRPVAVKVMLSEYGADAEFVEKFKREAQSAARLIHPNIAQIYSYGIADGMPYIAMELVSGGSLDQLMRNAPDGKTDIPRVMKLGEQVALALRCAADQGLVHGDIKPDNILLDSNGNAKIVDFGLAGMKNNTDEIWGTPYYIAPEKVRKEAVDYRADMYSLGGTLYHALTGVAPFEGPDAVAVVKQRFAGMPPKPSDIRPDISDAIDALVMKMLALEKGDRFPSFEALLQELARVMATGLTRSAAPAAPAAKKGMAVRKGGKTIVMKKKGGVSGGLKVPAKASVAAARQVDAVEGGEDEEEGGNLGVKVLAVVVGVILLVGGIIGGLVWYRQADASSKASGRVAQITKNIADARDAIRQTASRAVSFGEEFAVFSAQATAECEKATEDIAKLIPDFAAVLKPAPTEDLLAAIKLTNVVTAVANETAAATNQVAVASTNAPAATVTNAVEVAAAAPESAAPAAAGKDEPLAVQDVRSLWEKAYACQAANIRIQVELKKVAEECAKADELKGEDEATMNALGEMSRFVFEKFDQVRVSKDVETVQKGIGFIKSKGAKTIQKTKDELRIARLEAARKEQREKEEAEKKHREEELRAAHEKAVAEETQGAKECFQMMHEKQWLATLDFDRALKELDRRKQECTTAEGEIAYRKEAAKVAALKSMLTIFAANLKGYEFRKGTKKDGVTSLRGTKVVEVDDVEMTLLKPDGSKMKRTWRNIYEKYHGNLNELIIQFIERGRQTTTPRLSQLRWAEAMCGAALTMKLICSDDPAAAARSEKIVQRLVHEFPGYLEKAKDMFPEGVNFDVDPFAE